MSNREEVEIPERLGHRFRSTSDTLFQSSSDRRSDLVRTLFQTALDVVITYTLVDTGVHPTYR